MFSPRQSLQASKAYDDVHALFIRDEYAQAEKKAHELLKTYPDHTKTELLLAQIAMNRHHYEQALEWYTKVLHTSESNVEGRLGRAQCSFQLGDYEQALEDYLFLYERSLKTTSYVLALGDTYHALHLDKIALRYYQKALFWAASDIDVHLRLATHLERMGRHKDALEHTTQAKDLYYQQKDQQPAETLHRISELESSIEKHISKKHPKK